MTCTRGFYAMQFFAPMNSDCLAHYHKYANNATDKCLTWWGSVSISNDFATSFGWRLLETYLNPSPHQAWFCIYLFVYSQLMASMFSNYCDILKGSGYETAYGSKNREYNLTKKILIKIPFSSIWVMPVMNSKKFFDTTKNLIMDPIRLLVIPGMFLFLCEFLLRWKFPSKFPLSAFSFFLDWCNNIHFMGVYFLGYLIASGDSNGFSDILNKWRWWYVLSGFLLLQAYVVVYIKGDYWFSWITKYTFNCFLRGFGEWMFIIGVYAVNRNIFTMNYNIIKTLREMAMPFYLLHQQVLVVLEQVRLFYSLAHFGFHTLNPIW